jgi:hypothetical protein
MRKPHLGTRPVVAKPRDRPLAPGVAGTRSAAERLLHRVRWIGGRIGRVTGWPASAAGSPW